MKKLMFLLIGLIPIMLIMVVQVTSMYIESTQYVAVESISLSDEYVEILKPTDEDVLLDYPAKIMPLGATNKEVLYSSSNEEIAEVDENGTITFKNFGSVTITAQSKATSVLKDSCIFLVTDTKIHSVEITNKIETIIKGQTYYLSCSFKPIEALNKNLTFSSSDTQVATISPDGKITAVDGGETIITATSENGKSDSFVLSVFVPVSNIEIEESKRNVITGGNTLKFPEVLIYPNNATNQELVYESSDDDVAEISQEGEITFKTAGECVFVARSLDGGFTAEFKALYTGGYILSAKIPDGFNKTISMDYIYGKTIDIPVEISPSDADLSNIYYTSSNETAIAIVDGTPTIVGGGKATITVYARESESKSFVVGSVEISVNRPAESIKILGATEGVISIGEPNHQLRYEVLTPDQTDTIKFESSNPSLAQISASGYISFASPGYANFTVKANDSVFDTVKVEFIPVGKSIEITSAEQDVSVDYLDNFALIFVDGEIGSVEYTIDDPTVLEYDELEQSFSALKGGSTKVTATSNGKTVIINFTVIRKANDISYSVEGFNVEGNYIFTSKSQLQINACALPDDVTNKSVAFAVNNDNANINNDGLLTFSKAGEVVVSMTADEIVKTLRVVSTYGLPSDFQLTTNNVVLEDIGEKKQITEAEFVFTPDDYIFDLNDIQFSSQNSEIATIDDTGMISAVGKGTTEIYVEINGIKKAISVEVKVKTKSVLFSYKGEEIATDSVKVLGESISLSAVVYPLNANNQTVTFEVVSGDATITQAGLLSFTSDQTMVVVRVTTQDTGIYRDLTIDKVSGPEEIKIFMGEEDVTGKSLKVLPTDPNPIVNLKINSEGLLDANEINLHYVVGHADNESGLITTITFDGTSYFSITPKIYYNKSMSATCYFAYGTTESWVKFKFYVITEIDLALKASGDLRGLQQKRVFGSSSYIDGVYSETLPIEYNVKTQVDESILVEKTDCLDVLYWHSSNESVAYVNSEGKLQFNNANITEETTVTISVGNEATLEDSTVTASYTYTIVKGCNIYDGDGYNYCVDNSKRYNIVLQAHLGTEQEQTLAEQTGDRYSYFTPCQNDIYGKIYGNGYILNFENFDTASRIGVVHYNSVYNVTIKGHDDNTDKSGFAYILCFEANGSIEYSIIQNMKRGISISGTNTLTLKNSIIRYVTEYGILMCKEAARDVYLENTIFHDVGQCAINYQNGEIYIKGFFDVYNFSSYLEYPDSYQDQVKTALEASDFSNYVDKSGGSVESYLINTAIASFRQVDPRYPTIQDTVHFYNESSGQYEANSDNCTGLGYDRLVGKTGSFIKITTIYLWTPPTSCSIKVGQVPDETKVYRTV